MKIWRNLEKNKSDFTYAAKSKRFIIFDTETTGLKEQDEIIEFAACKCYFKDGEFKVYDIIHLYIKPRNPVSDKISEINGLTNEFLADKMCEMDAYYYIRQFMGDSPVVGAYNSAFDVRMLRNMYARCGDVLKIEKEIDLLKIAKDIFCEQKMKDHKLITIANTYNVDQNIQFHSAMDDVKVLIRVINAMIADINKNGVSDTTLQHVKVYKLNYYEGYRGNNILYAITSGGMIYYQFKTDKWMPKDPAIDLNKIDMADVEKQVFAFSGCIDYKELHKKCKSGAFSYHADENKEVSNG